MKIKILGVFLLLASTHSPALECEIFAGKCTAVDGLIFSAHSNHNWSIDYQLGWYSPFIFFGDSHIKEYYCLPIFTYSTFLRVEYDTVREGFVKERKKIICRNSAD